MVVKQGHFINQPPYSKKLMGKGYLSLFTFCFSLLIIAWYSNLCYGQGSWMLKNGGGSKHLNSIQFINDKEGWTTSLSDTLLHSIDGGESWIPVVPGLKGFSSINFINTDTGWVRAACQQYQAVCRTVNRGQLWNSFMFTLPNWINDMYPISTQISWAIGGIDLSGSRSHFKISFNSDGSTTTDTWTVFMTTGTLNGIHFYDKDNGWSVGSKGIIIHITLGSANSPVFTTQNGGTEASLSRIFCVSQQSAYIVGDSGIILKTIDGGNSWQHQTSGTINHLSSIYFITADTGIACGDSGLILRTYDGGINWKKEVSGTVNSLSSVFMLNNTTIWAVGKNGTILKYSVEMPVASVLSTSYSIDFADISNPNSILVKYCLPIKSTVSLKIFSIQGKLYNSIFNSDKNPGSYQISIKNHHLSNGYYILSFKAGNYFKNEIISIYH
jgi:photosystem II stability/assembly factor-like uncharacterized protein